MGTLAQLYVFNVLELESATNGVTFPAAAVPLTTKHQKFKS